MVLQRLEEWPDFPKGLKVLILDNDPVSLEATQQLLQQCDYCVTGCSSCADAVALLQQPSQNFHLLLAELGMVTSSEDQTLLSNATQGLPVVLMGHNPPAADIMQGLFHGAEAFLQRPLVLSKARTLWQHTVRRMMAQQAMDNSSRKQKRPRDSQTSDTGTPSDISAAHLLTNFPEFNVGDNEAVSTHKPWSSTDCCKGQEAAVPAVQQEVNSKVLSKQVLSEALAEHQHQVPVVSPTANWQPAAVPALPTQATQAATAINPSMAPSAVNFMPNFSFPMAMPSPMMWQMPFFQGFPPGMWMSGMPGMGGMPGVPGLSGMPPFAFPPMPFGCAFPPGCVPPPANPFLPGALRNCTMPAFHAPPACLGVPAQACPVASPGAANHLGSVKAPQDDSAQLRLKKSDSFLDMINECLASS